VDRGKMHGQEMGALPGDYADGSKFTAVGMRVVALAFLTAVLDGLDLQIIAYAAPAMARDGH